MSTVATHIERVPWDEFLPLMDWQQGDHVTTVGPTKAGKTTLFKELIPERRFQMFLQSKRIDATQEDLESMGFRVVGDVDEVIPDLGERWIIRPPFPKTDNAADVKSVQRNVFKKALMRAYNDGHWAVFIDEARVICDICKLQDETVLLWTQGRSAGNTIIAGTQRPRFIPLEAYDSATHLFFFKSPDEQNVRRVAEMAGVNKRRTEEAVQALAPHEFVYVYTPTGATYISKVEI